MSATPTPQLDVLVFDESTGSISGRETDQASREHNIGVTPTATSEAGPVVSASPMNWKSAGHMLAAPLGTALVFRCEVPPGCHVVWRGARESEQGPEASIAVVRLNRPGVHLVRATIFDARGWLAGIASARVRVVISEAVDVDRDGSGRAA